MNRARTPHDPLRGHNWRDGVEPAPEPIPASQQPVEPPEFDWDPFAKRSVMARRAAAIIRQNYGIESGDMRRMAQHDNETQRIWNQLMDGTYQPPESTMTLIDPKEAAAALANDVRNPRNWR